MAAASLQCYPLLNSPRVPVSRSFSARTPVRGRTGQALGSRMKLCCCSQSAERQPPDDSPPQLERLFSNVNQTTMKHEPGSVTGSIFLVAGTTVGAGILAIPAVTQEAGFLASAVTCIFCWIYMVVTGLLVAEVNVNTMCELGSGGVSLVSMAQRTLGTLGVRTACFSYLFIHYALLVAYVARSSEIITNSLGIPIWESATLFSLAFGGLCYFGSQRVIGAVNGFLVFSIIASFTTLVVVASGNIQWSSLLETNFAAAPQSIPIIALSFVYQSHMHCLEKTKDLEKQAAFLITKGQTYHEFSVRLMYYHILSWWLLEAHDIPPESCRKAIVLGTAIPLALFLIWDAVILGTIPGLAGSETITDPLQQLRSSNGIVGPIVEAFSFLAICTSYIGFVLGLSDFIADLLKLPSGQNKPLTYLVTLLPPLVLSLLDPEIFFKALDFAGTYGVLVLFGVFPAAMSWSERYSDDLEAPISPIVPGGKFTLSFVMGGALVVIFSEIFKDILQLQGLY